MMLWFR